jgi:hypothetical protein
MGQHRGHRPFRRTDEHAEADVSEYWFNTKSRQVEEGHQSDWQNLMGPYPTREQAERALETAKANTEKWDREDAEWQDRTWSDSED